MPNPDREARTALPGDGSASSSDPTGKIPIPRKIHLDCTTNRLLIWPHKREIELPGSGTLDEPLAQLSDEIAREITTWGPAGSTFRWQPLLVCHVRSGALDTFYRLRFALAGGSVEIDHEFVFDGSDATLGGLLSGSQPSTLNSQHSEN